MISVAGTDVSGLPIISICCGFSSPGLPMGMQIAAKVCCFKSRMPTRGRRNGIRETVILAVSLGAHGSSNPNR
jgi:hypothetical protein